MIISGITINKDPFSQAFAASGIKIAAVGNWGCTSNSQATVNNINSKNPELVLGWGIIPMKVPPIVGLMKSRRLTAK
jgi:hypothetical protein